VPLPPWFQPSASASWSLVRPPLSCVSRHESTMWPIVCHWPQSQHSGAARPHFCKLAQYGPWSVHKQCLGLAWQVEARLLDVRVVGRMLDADWPQEPTMSILPTAFSFWWVLLLPKWGNEMWVTAHDGKHWVSRLADSLLPGVVPGFSTAMTLACRHSPGTCCPGPVMTLEEKVESHVMSLGPKLCLSNSRQTLSYPGAMPFFIWLRAGQLDSQNQLLVANCTLAVMNVFGVGALVTGTRWDLTEFAETCGLLRRWDQAAEAAPSPSPDCLSASGSFLTLVVCMCASNNNDGLSVVINTTVHSWVTLITGMSERVSTWVLPPLTYSTTGFSAPVTWRPISMSVNNQHTTQS